ncbi:MAG: hypothetical protein V1857_04355 [archaeon]
MLLLVSYPLTPHVVGHSRRSIEGFGFKAPILIDEKSGYIATGHGRVDALSALKKAGRPPPEHIKVVKDE